MLGWADLIRAVAARRPVYYIETREKSSACITRQDLEPSQFCMPK